MTLLQAGFRAFYPAIPYELTAGKNRHHVKG